MVSTDEYTFSVAAAGPLVLAQGCPGYSGYYTRATSWKIVKDDSSRTPVFSGDCMHTNASYDMTPGNYRLIITGNLDQDYTASLNMMNRAPSAAFVSSASGLTASLDGSGSSDPDGGSLTYAWTYGDGATGTGVKSSHAYTAAGTYSVKLTVTDSGGLSSTVTKSVTTTVQTIATDTFTRSASGAWGTATSGGAWTVSNTASKFAVNGSQGTVTLSASSDAPLALLGTASAKNVNTLADVATNKVGTGNGTWTTLVARHTSTGEYRLRMKFLPSGVLKLSWSKVVSGTETAGSEVTVSGVTYAASSAIRIRFQVSTSGTTTSLRGTVWKPGATEPTSPQLSATDSTASLQNAGSVGLLTSLGSGVTNVPVAVNYDNLTVVAG